MRRVYHYPILVLLTCTSTWAQNPSAILSKAESTAVQQSAYSRVKMKAERPRYTREMELRSWNMGNNFSLVQITAPERDAGMVYMKADKSLMTYSPRTEKVMKLPASMLMQGWMGTDAQFDNILGAASLSQDFTHSYQGKKTVNGHECHVIRCAPKPSTPVAHDHVDAFVSVKDESWVRLVFFDKKGVVSQQMDALHFRRFDGILMPDLIQFTAKGGVQTTTLTILEWKKRPDLKPSFFNEASMRTADQL
ncbi:MAG: outer membrane lipoprotein-sorting protein [Schleiferiaceae bacterium]|nr:outer membrane lipoprotein-sorting protein [Schleiferiaceae bacterium]